MAEFLYKEEGLNKTAIGNFLGERYGRPEVKTKVKAGGTSPALFIKTFKTKVLHSQSKNRKKVLFSKKTNI